MLEQCRNRILAVLRQDGVTKVLIAAQAGVHRNAFIGLELASWNPNSHTLDAIMGVVEKLEKPKAAAQ